MRESGILMHISSLPSAHGIGTMGKAAYNFIDFLHESGVSVWQMLPMGPTGYGDSPYQSFCSFAGNPYFIDLDMLAEDGLIDEAYINGVDWGGDESRVDYGKIYAARNEVFKLIYERGYERYAGEVARFEKERPWLRDYAMFMALKEKHGGASWMEWEDGARLRREDAMRAADETLSREIQRHEFIQYLFFSQWERLKRYANERGVRLLGDMPIYVASDSSDAWANPDVFVFDENRRPTHVAGVPPDYFSQDGQLWGNPLYDWAALRETGYKWWVERIRAMTTMFDTVRIDHFIGFVRYYAIPAGSPTAKVGEWHEGPGKSLFDALRRELGKLPIVAEDLGLVTDSVRELLGYCGFPGMKVMEFAFGADGTNTHLPHNVGENTVYYIATHDNDTAAAWWQSAPDGEKAFFMEYFGLSYGGDINDAIIKALMRSRAELAVIAMQDLLSLGAEARMNTPGTCGGNWCWRARTDDFTKNLSDRLRRLNGLYTR